MQPFTERVIQVIKSIPEGKVATYGGIAELAGNHNGARQVARILHSSSKKQGLPWYRVINREGKISLPRGRGYEEQKLLLEDEGVFLNQAGKIDLEIYRWNPF